MRASLGWAAIALLGVSVVAEADVIDVADVGGFRTFQDTNTGRVWLDLDSFFATTTDDMIVAASAAGFSWATRADVEQLVNTLPLTNATQYSSYAAVMGDYTNPRGRSNIWGAYDDGGDPLRAGSGFGVDGSVSLFGWYLVDFVVVKNLVVTGDGDYSGMGLWAYHTGSQAPEPSALTLLGLAVLALACARGRPSRPCRT